MSWSRIQASHLIGVYCVLLILGVFLEVDLPLNRHQPSGNKVENQILQQPQKVKESWSVRNKVSYLKKAFKNNLLPDRSDTTAEFASSYFSIFSSTEGYIGVRSLRSVFNKRNTSESYNYLLKLNFKSSLNDYEKVQPVKVSPDLNAFDDMVTMLTGSATYCTKLDSINRMKSHVPESLYHCTIRNFSKCNHGDSRSKYKKFSRRCSKNKRITGYNINPANLVQTKNRKRGTITYSDQSEDKTENFGGELKYIITVDAKYSFIDDFKRLRYTPRMRLDFKLDLAGLNSLHKYEIVVKLLKIIRSVLNQQGYHLERSSADSHLLQQYLHEEGLHQPLYVLTLWRHYS